MPEATETSTDATAVTADANAKADQNTDDSGPNQPKMTNGQVVAYMKSRMESSKRTRRALYPEWKRNVELRIGHVATLYTGGVDVQDEIQTEINPDWSLTKTKTANLYSQVPTVRLTHENQLYAPAIAPFGKALNYELGTKRANVGVAMEEMLNDIVNAAGVGAIYVYYTARFKDKLVPALEQLKSLPPQALETLQEVEVPVAQEVTPDQLAAFLQAGQIPMKRTPEVTSDKICTSRVSPIDLLWPTEFTGSNFDDGDFIGHTGRCSWSQGKTEFKLKDEDYQKVITGDNNPVEESLRSNPEKSGLAETKKLTYHELFYWRVRVDPDEPSFDCIWRLVFVDGLDEPAVHEPWKGQKLDQSTGKYLGNKKFPIRVCTLTYITDNPIPPSDSSAGRPQVNDMRRSRRDMFNNRERSIPIRWFDVNRIDQTIQTMLMRGTWQGMIPTNGDGSRSIGEIARASYPAENLAFDQQAMTDLMTSWQLGPNQQGTANPTDESAAAANITQQNFATRIGQERGRVAACFLSIAEQVAGQMVLYSDFPILSDQEKAAMQQAWDQTHVLHDLVFKILPDSQVVLDVNQRIKKLVDFLNITVKSGYVNPKPIITEIAELSGLDPALVVMDPQEQKDEPNVSYRFSGKDDLQNPLVVAMLMIKGDMPNIQQIEQAKQLLLAAQTPAQPPAPAQAPPDAGGPDGAPDASPPAEGAPAGPKPMAPTAGAHPDWHLSSKIAQRSRDTGV